jgi:hypothetical protein
MIQRLKNFSIGIVISNNPPGFVARRFVKTSYVSSFLPFLSSHILPNVLGVTTPVNALAGRFSRQPYFRCSQKSFLFGFVPPYDKRLGSIHLPASAFWEELPELATTSIENTWRPEHR